MRPLSRYDHNRLNIKSLLTTSAVVKLAALVSSVNLLLTIAGFLAWRGDSDMIPEPETVGRNTVLELSKFTEEGLSRDVVTGAPIIWLKGDDALRDKFPSCDDITFGPGDKVEVSNENICPQDIYFSVRSSKKYHRRRLKVLIDTWFSVTPENVNIFTDQKDIWLDSYMKANLPEDSQPEVVVTDCPLSTENKWGLLCKLYWEYRTFLGSDKKWFCHFDDDSYVNVKKLVMLLNLYSSEEQIYIGRSPSSKPVIAVAFDTEIIRPEIWMINDTSNETTWKTPEQIYQRVGFHFALGGAGYCFTRQLALDMKETALGSRMLHSASSISLPDDCVIGYIITHLLGVSLVSTDLMHSHFEDFREIPESSLAQQVTLSYSLASRSSKNESDNSENTIFFRDRLPDQHRPSKHRTPNIINLNGPKSISNDPTGFRRLHKLVTRGENY